MSGPKPVTAKNMALSVSLSLSLSLSLTHAQRAVPRRSEFKEEEDNLYTFYREIVTIHTSPFKSTHTLPRDRDWMSNMSTLQQKGLARRGT